MDDVTSGVTDLNWFNILIIFGRNHFAGMLFNHFCRSRSLIALILIHSRFIFTQCFSFFVYFCSRQVWFELGTEKRNTFRYKDIL